MTDENTSTPSADELLIEADHAIKYTKMERARYTDLVEAARDIHRLIDHKQARRLRNVSYGAICRLNKALAGLDK
tara:strand:- start:15875 stop:16099 length:225 start_codon:yes stop_codon:yes gene_type:complete